MKFSAGLLSFELSQAMEWELVAKIICPIMVSCRGLSHVLSSAWGGMGEDWPYTRELEVACVEWHTFLRSSDIRFHWCFPSPLNFNFF